MPACRLDLSFPCSMDVSLAQRFNSLPKMRFYFLSGVMEGGFQGTHAQFEQCSHFLVGHLFIIAQFEYLALTFGQLFQRKLKSSESLRHLGHHLGTMPPLLRPAPIVSCVCCF